MTTFSTDEQSRAKRQQLQRVQQLAANGEWEEAVELNREMLGGAPKDVAALNRLGKALSELRRYGEAYAAYSQAVELDPVNQIAKRNLQRLEPLKDQGDEEGAGGAAERRRTQARQSMFIEEIGKTRVTELQKVAPNETLARMTSGDQIELKVEGKQIIAYSEDGLRLGQFEARLSRRLITLIEGGNRYGAAVTAVEPGMLRVIVRELYQHPSQAGRLSFPVESRPVAPRPYLRDSTRLYAADDSDFLNDDDGDDDEGDADGEEDEEFTETEETTADEPEEEQTI